MQQQESIAGFFARAGGIRLREYQAGAARAIVDSVLGQRGLSFAVMFPRQSGKNELQAQIEALLLWALSRTDAEIVKVSPTWRPQSLNAMRRLERVLSRHPCTRQDWVRENGYIYRVGRARIVFLSGSPEAHIVGATASTLLEVDEAQDVTQAKYDRDIAPMAASTNATRVFWGTAWTSQTLLAREVRALRRVEAQDGQQRVFVVSAERVAREVPAYGDFVAAQVASLGRDHPLVRTQFFSEEIDEQVGMFPAAAIAALQGDHPAQDGPRPGKVYALLVDVGGEADQEQAAEADRRDSTAVTIVAVEPETSGAGRLPVYRVMGRRVWTGVRHTRLYAEIQSLAQHWRARWLVVDATGVGAGLASFLDAALPGRVKPFIFSQASKSKLGWDFLAITAAGRWKEPLAPPGAGPDPLQALFLRQLAFTRSTLLPGPGKTLRWGVPDGARDPADGAYIHDDLVMSAALCAALERLDWPPPGMQGAGFVRAPDPLAEMDGDTEG